MIPESLLLLIAIIGVSGVLVILVIWIVTETFQFRGERKQAWEIIHRHCPEIKRKDLKITIIEEQTRRGELFYQVIFSSADLRGNFCMTHDGFFIKHNPRVFPYQFPSES